MIHSTPDRRRRGTILILFALIVFALFALAAIVIDLGFVRLTQQEMQTGTDTAALEGLRWRDVPPPPTWNLAGSPDQQRRQLASQLSALQYDADYNLATTDNQYGAGPVISFTGGVTEANALQSVTGTGVYKPNLQENAQDNDPAGDMVAGNFALPLPPEQPVEGADYTRNDFTADPVGHSFLVRMRRTEDPRETATNTPGVSSVGPSLPLLFGRGSMIAGGDPNAGYSVRFHGLTVRSTSIADAIPARSVGVANAAADIPGVTPFAVALSVWNAATPGQANTISVSFLATNGAVTMGQDITTLAGAAPSSATSGMVGYVPIFSDYPDAPNWIVGFGYVSQWSFSGSGNMVSLTPATATVAPRNATTALYPAAWTTAFTADQLTLVMKINSGQATPDAANPNVLQPGLMNPLLAPALVR